MTRTSHSSTRAWALRCVVVFGSIFLMIAGAMLADRVYGRFLMPESSDLVYPAYSRAHHQSSEFDLTVSINGLGFRGPQVSTEKTRRRVMLLGDSFTFGWGVAHDETWGHLLQKEFPHVEMLNLGKGGTHPGDHVQMARKAIPALKPDLIIWGILQGNDLGQLMRVMAYEQGQTVVSIPKAIIEDVSPSIIARWSRTLLPNFNRRWPQVINISDRWAMESSAIVASMTAVESARYRQLDAEIRTAFEGAQLNPSLIFEALHHPEMYRTAVDTSDQRLKEAIIRLSHHLLEVQAMCMAAKIDLLIISLPNRPYGCADCVAGLSDLGFDVAGCDTMDADLPFALAVQAARMEADAIFRVFAPNAACFYPLDGHWNNVGNRIFADSLARRLKTHPKWNSLQTSGNL